MIQPLTGSLSERALTCRCALGQGLAEALEGATILVDVSNAPSWEDTAVMDFFQQSTRNLLDAEVAAGVKHHMALSVVGSDRLQQSGYFRAKLAQVIFGKMRKRRRAGSA